MNLSHKTPARLLVVDDDAGIRRMIQQRLRRKDSNRKLSFEFLFAENGEQALEILRDRTTEIDIILTDLSMPVMDGLTLLDKLSSIDPTLKAIVMSAHDDMHNIRTAMNLGAFDFLTKPFDFRDLELTLQKTLTFVRETRQQKQQLKQALSKLQNLAFYDELTGIPNRGLLLNCIHHCLLPQKHSHEIQELLPSFSLLFIKLNRYQIIKYSLSHEAGDRLLQEVAQRLRSSVPSEAMVARVGVENFAILLKNLSQFSDALQVAEAVHQTLQNPLNLGGPIITCKANIGIVQSDIGYEYPEQFLVAADTAMHYAQMRGQGCTAVFGHEMQVIASKRLQLESDLQQAIHQGQLYLVYQPIVSLVTGETVGVEALVRWRHPQKGTVLPSEFIPLAEETGLIVPLNEWVLREVCLEFCKLQQQFPEIRFPYVCVNLSSIQLGDPALLSQLDAMLPMLESAQIKLKLEITESMVVENPQETIPLLEQLKVRQIQLCVDDFGTGYSSLSYLQNLPIDVVKLDRSFIQDLETNSTNLHIVKAIISLAEDLGIDAIAEGIETSEQHNILRSLSCLYGQGFLFARPLTSHQLVEFLSRSANAEQCTYPSDTVHCSKMPA